jgi:hypothetical protein
MMDGQVLGFIGIGVTVLINVGLGAYSYGKLSQKVNDIANTLNGNFTCEQHSEITERLGRVEGQLDVSTTRKK